MIKLIIFDFGGTVGCDFSDWKKTFKKIPLATGLSILELDEIFDRDWPEIKTGKESLKQFWKHVASKSKQKVNAERLKRIYLKSITVKGDMLKIAKNLKRKYKLVVLMNAGDEDGKQRRALLNGIFDKVYNSAEMGIAKPDLKAFNFVLKDQDVNPNECLFIDNSQDFVEVAKKLGINSILFKNIKALKRDLAKFLTN